MISSLIDRSDFDDQWIWVFESTTQEIKTPSPENSYLVDEATRGIDGYSGSTQNLVEVWHTLACYLHAAPEPSLSFKFESQYQTFEVAPIRVGKNSALICKQSDFQIVCESSVNYGSVASRTIVDISNGLENEANDIVNNVLSKLDTKLSAISDCHNK